MLAQERTVSGKVTSAEDGTGLPGVNVILRGTSTGTVTDIDGNFTLEVPAEGGTLQFSFVGMETQEIPIGNRSVIDVTMATDIQQLSEVVVTALGIEREERSLGYSTQNITGEEISTVREANVVNSLSGRISGVQVTGGSAQGGSSRILIRGASSITGNNQPLFVVDGVPIDNTTYTTTNQARGGGGFDYGNFAQDINPDDIASINVLKGAAAAALYGSRAANGVIEITTKKGARKEAGVGVMVNSSVTFDDVLILPDYQNEYGGGYSEVSSFNEEGQRVIYYGADESWGPRLDGRPMRQWYSYFPSDPNFGEETPWVAHPDNIESFFETGVTWNNNVAVMGSNDRANFRLSYTNMDQSFILPNGEQTRHTLSFAGGYDITDRFNTSITANYVHNSARGRPGTGYDAQNVANSFNQWFQRQVDMSRLENYTTPDGLQRTWNITSPNDLSPNYWDNPYWVRYENFQNDERDRLFGNLTLSYDVTDEIKITGRVLSDYYTDRREERIAVGSLDPSSYSEAVREFHETNYELRAEYNNQFGEDFSLFAFVGGNIRNEIYNLNYGATQGGLSIAGFYSLENSIDRPLITDNSREKEVQSVFGSASVGFRDMLYLDVTGRNDWSSTLPTDNNSYFYPSVTTSFVFSEILDVAPLTFGKFRAGWAQVGNDTDPYNLYTVYAPVTNFGSDPMFTVPNVRNNPDLKPERTTSYEFGLELGFFDKRLGLDVTYYNSRTEDQIINIPTTPATGYSTVFINAGEMKNYGVELTLNGAPIVTEEFRWDITVNWARNRNEVVELAEGVSTYRFASLFGGAVEARLDEPYGAIVGRGFVYDDNGQKMINPDGTFMTTSEDVYLGSFLPDWTGGITNSFSYKGIRLNVLIGGQRGGSIYSVSNMFGKYSGLYEETVEGEIREKGLIFEGVREDGTPNDVVITAQSAFASLFRLHEAFVYDASFIKLREASLVYRLPQSILDQTPFNNVDVGVVGRNLAFLYKEIPHIDPETTTNAGNIQGIEGGAVPTTRSWGFSLRFGL